MKEERSLDISVVMACLNEAETVGSCVENAVRAFRELDLRGEVLVVDNGSTDGSVEIAKEKSARVVFEAQRGYGHAYRRGFREARGRFLVMGDADGTYDFSLLGPLIEPLKNGTDLVIGSRLKGQMLPGAMPWFKLEFGNRLSTRVVNTLFGMKLTDSQSGFRAFRRTALQGISFESTGMEFATEMIIGAFRKGMRIAEVPIIYYPRQGGFSKFKIFRDSISILVLIFSFYFHSNGFSRRNEP